MTVLRLTFDRTASSVIDQVIASLGESELREILAPVGEAIVEHVQQNFVNQRDPWGTPWQALSGVTIMLRARKRGIKIFATRVRGGRRRRTGLTARARSALPGQASGFRILVDLRALANGIVSQTSGRSVRVTVSGPAKKYARVQQQGNPRNRLFGKALAPIPARPFMPIRAGRVDLPAVLRDEIRAMVSDGILRAVRGGVSGVKPRMRTG